MKMFNDLYSKSENMENVVLITSHYSPDAGGVFEVVKAHSRELAARHYNVKILSVLSHDLEQTTESLVTVVSIGDKNSLAFGIFRILKELRNASPDIVHVHGMWMPSVSIALWFLQWTFPHKLVVTPHGMLDAWALRNSRLKKIAASLISERNLLRRADAVHCLTMSEERDVSNYLGVSANTLLIPNGVDLPAVRRFEAEIITSKKVLLFLGRIHPKKGILEAVRAWHIVGETSPALFKDWVFVIAGPSTGSYYQTLVDETQRLSLTNNISFIGAVEGERKSALLQQASAFILSSHSEGMPMAVLEAWAYSLPVFMTRGCNLNIAFEVNAAFEITMSPENIARELIIHLNDDDLSRYGKQGRKLVDKTFNWDFIAQELSDSYRELLEK